MQFQTKISNAAETVTPCLVIGICKQPALTPNAEAINIAGEKQLQHLLKAEGFTGSTGETLLLHHHTGQKSQRLLLIGFGKKNINTVSEENYIQAISALVTATKNVNYKELTIDFSDITVKNRDAQWQSQILAQTFVTRHWQFDHMKSQKNSPSLLKKIYVSCLKSSKSSTAKGLDFGVALSGGINYARELGDLPANICTPTYLSKEAHKLARNQPQLAVKVLNEKQMKSLGMHSLLSVSAGSDEPAQLIVMNYQGGAKSTRPTVLVGKGITFDTGGISLKPGLGMDEMKYDMCGAASVYGAMKTLVSLQPKINVIAVVAASENMPNGSATKPGDIITSMSGQTIEILNTDAEGRLVLCDALTYTKKFNPKRVIDIATLTGACVVALGSHAHGLYSNNEALAQDLLASGNNANDKAWHMPLWDEYQKQLHSNFADIANIGGREAGSITAACFLSRFTKDFKWAHLDIAGTAWKSGVAKGATGRPVPLLVDYLINNA